MNKFTDYQFKQFDKYFKKVMKSKLMSFYSYLNYHFSCDQEVKMSIDELTNRWNNKHKKKAKKEKCVCRATIYNWIKKLKTAKLIVIDEESSDTFIYTLISENIFLDEKLDKELDNVNSTSPIENIEVVGNEKCDTSLPLVNNLDIDSNTVTTAPTNLNFKKYIEKCSYEYAMSEMLSVFQILKVKSNFIKSIVIAKVERYYWNISKVGCKFYIGTLISQAQAQCKKNFRDKCLYNSSSKISTWNDYPQRAFDPSVEDKLLGWE